MAQNADANITTQIYEIYIKASQQAIWDAITKREWTAKYGYQAPIEYDLRPGGACPDDGGDGRKQVLRNGRRRLELDSQRPQVAAGDRLGLLAELTDARPREAPAARAAPPSFRWDPPDHAEVEVRQPHGAVPHAQAVAAGAPVVVRDLAGARVDPREGELRDGDPDGAEPGGDASSRSR